MFYYGQSLAVIINYSLYVSLHVDLPIPCIWLVTTPTLNILRIVQLASTARALFGGGQTNVNRRMIACLGASPRGVVVSNGSRPTRSSPGARARVRPKVRFIQVVANSDSYISVLKPDTRTAQTTGPQNTNGRVLQALETLSG